MIGAIIGDVVGSRFEFDNINTKDFDFWGDGCKFTDDTVMTIAVAESLLYTKNPDELGNVFKDIMRDYGHGYPNVGYGGMFRQWLMSADPQPYNSFGNGSAMRVSPCGYVADQDTVPQSIQCFLLADSFEDTIRNAVSIGGDSDTIACIAGSIAEAYYGIPDEFIEKAKTYLPKCFINVIDKFYSFVDDNSSLKQNNT